MQDLIAKLLGGRSPTVVAAVIGVAGLVLAGGSASGHVTIPAESANTLLGAAVAVVGIVIVVAKAALHMDPPDAPKV